MSTAGSEDASLFFLPPFFSVSLRPRFDSVYGQEDIYIYIQTNGCVSSSEWVNGSLGGWAKSALNAWANKSLGGMPNMPLGECVNGSLGK